MDTFTDAAVAGMPDISILETNPTLRFIEKATVLPPSLVTLKD